MIFLVFDHAKSGFVHQRAAFHMPSLTWFFQLHTGLNDHDFGGHNIIAVHKVLDKVGFADDVGAEQPLVRIVLDRILELFNIGQCLERFMRWMVRQTLTIAVLAATIIEVGH